MGAGLALIKGSWVSKDGTVLTRASDFPPGSGISGGDSAVEPGPRGATDVLSIFSHRDPEGQCLEYERIYERILPGDRDGRIVRTGGYWSRVLSLPSIFPQKRGLIDNFWNNLCHRVHLAYSELFVEWGKAVTRHRSTIL